MIQRKYIIKNSFHLFLFTVLFCFFTVATKTLKIAFMAHIIFLLTTTGLNNKSAGAGSSPLFPAWEDKDDLDLPTQAVSYQSQGSQKQTKWFSQTTGQESPGVDQFVPLWESIRRQVLLLEWTTPMCPAQCPAPQHPFLWTSCILHLVEPCSQFPQAFLTQSCRVCLGSWQMVATKGPTLPNRDFWHPRKRLNSLLTGK